jgi:DNA-binding XRE family transcriptional regulator
MKKQNLIYSLVCPFTNETHYVGKTTQGMLSPMSHLNESHSEKIKEWVGNLKEFNYTPIIKILEYVEKKEDLNSKERQWIQHYLDNGNILLNTHFVTPKMIKSNIDGLLSKDDGDTMSKISKFVKMKRKSLKLTQAEFANKIGIALTVIRKIEQGKSNVNLDSLLDILKIFDCTINIVKTI